MILLVYVMCVSCSINAVRRNSYCCAGTDKAQPSLSLFCVVFLHSIHFVFVPYANAACGRDGAVVLSWPPRQFVELSSSIPCNPTLSTSLIIIWLLMRIFTFEMITQYPVGCCTRFLVFVHEVATSVTTKREGETNTSDDKSVSDALIVWYEA